MNSSQTRKELLEQYEDSLLRLVMHDVAEQDGQIFLDESKALKDSLESRPSPEALERFTRGLDAELKKQRSRAASRPYFLKSLNTVAVAVLAVIVVFFTAMTTVGAFRTQVMNFWLDIRPEYTTFKLKGSDDTTDGGSMVVNWTNAYVPTYIPEGYQVSSLSYSVGNKTIAFVKDSEETYIIYRELDESSNPVVDTEDASRFEAIGINGHSGMLIVKNGMVTIVWETDARLFVIQAQTSVEAAVKIAEGVKYIK